MLSSHRVSLGALAVLALVAAAPTSGHGQQVKLSIDPRASIAWWEVSPNLDHLWATTCPQDPGWQPGEGGSIGHMVERFRRNPTPGNRAVDSTKVPLYPRRVVRSLCTPAVSGEISAADTVTWKGTRGIISIQTQHIVTGLDYRDEYARNAIYGTSAYPDIRFHIDSVVNVRRAQDVLLADAVGQFEFRGVRTAMRIPVRATHEGGGIRVQGHTHIPASYLTEQYGISTVALGMSVGLRIWKDLYMGLDVILKPATDT